MFRFFESRIVAVEPDRRDYRKEHGHRDAQACPDDGNSTNAVADTAANHSANHSTNHSANHTQKTKRNNTRTQKWRFSKSCIIPSLLLLASFASLIYPHAAMWLSQYHMSEVAAEYAKLITHAVPAPHEQLRRAREYNQKLSSGAIYEANTNIPTSHGETSDASQDYWEQLKANDDGLMARLRIKKIDLDLPVYHGTEDATLLKGLGHLRGTSLPVGGKGTRSVITGHRGLASAEMFTRLDEIVKGDTFTIEVFDEILTYKVVDKIVVNPDETKKIAAVPGKDLVTLITCTPLGINTQRILVTGERVIPTPAADKALRGKKPDIPRFPWWVVGCAGSLLIVGSYIWWAGLPVKKKKKDDESDADDADAGAAGAAGAGAGDADGEASVNTDDARVDSAAVDSAAVASEQLAALVKASAGNATSAENSTSAGDMPFGDDTAEFAPTSSVAPASSVVPTSSTADLERAEAQAVANRLRKRPKVRSAGVHRKRSHRAKNQQYTGATQRNRQQQKANRKTESILDWIMNVLGL